MRSAYALGIALLVLLPFSWGLSASYPQKVFLKGAEIEVKVLLQNAENKASPLQQIELLAPSYLEYRFTRMPASIAPKGSETLVFTLAPVSRALEKEVRMTLSVKTGGQTQFFPITAVFQEGGTDGSPGAGEEENKGIPFSGFFALPSLSNDLLFNAVLVAVIVVLILLLLAGIRRLVVKKWKHA